MMDRFVCESRRPVVVARHGAVACADIRASQAGLDILRAGGNAADAAVSMAAALAVTLPMSCGLGGDVFCLYYDSKTKEVKALNGSGRSASSMTLEYVKSQGYNARNLWPETHGLTCTVPGSPAALLDIVKHFGNGKLTMGEILDPAINLAEEGFPVSQIGAVYWKKGEHILKDKVNTYGGSLLIDGQAPKWGEVFHNHDMAATLRRIAKEGAAGFYEGPIAEAIVEAVKLCGGLLTLEDLANHKSTFEEPYSTDYDGVRLWEVGPSSQGIVALMALNIIKKYDFKAMGHNSVDYLHHMIEAFRLSFTDAMNFIADPSKADLPTDKMVSQEYADERSKLINSKKALKDLPVGELSMGRDTVYLTAVDGEGNACSFIMSNYMGFGTGMVPKGCGFSLQNRGYNFSFEEDSPNVIAPCKRPYHTIIPAILTDDKTGDLLLSYGVMGGFMQPQGHLQVLLNMKLFNMNPQQALDQPRFCIGPGHRSPVGAVNFEEGFPQSTLDELRARGHNIEGPVSGHRRALFGRGHVISRGAWWAGENNDISNDPNVLWAGSDKRADGIAIGY